MLQDSGSTASLRGIDAVSREVAWASGSGGTVLRTVDGGKHWVKCAVPEGGEKLDFRGVQAFDAETAIVMSSGTGDLSRLYKTVDGCATWKLVFTNPDKDGFWDALRFEAEKKPHLGILLGDPLHASFPFWVIDSNVESGPVELEDHKRRPKANKGEAAFAASNSSIFVANVFFDLWIGTGGVSGARIIKRINHDFDSFGWDTFPSQDVAIGHRTASSGIFSLSFRPNVGSRSYEDEFLSGVAVGGDYEKPDDASNIAAFTIDGGENWTPSKSQPHGYRSSVAYDSQQRVWITVGPNGSDVSFDDGKNWRAFRPGKNDVADADQHWNALSLPFVVGSKGRIGVLRDEAVKAAQRQ